jgi:hypothetical protein
MQRILAVFLAIAAFLAVCVYWLWQVAAGRPGLEAEDIAWRALLAMVVAYIAGRFLGRLGVSVISEAWQEARARRRDRELVRAMAAEESGESSGGATGEAEPRPEA